MEKALTDVQHTLAIQFQRIADMQAELDKLSTTVRDHLGQPHAAGARPAAGPGAEPRHTRTGS